MAIASKTFKTQTQKFNVGDTVPDDIAEVWPRFISAAQPTFTHSNVAEGMVSTGTVKRHYGPTIAKK